jgi:hypothetical protein
MAQVETFALSKSLKKVMDDRLQSKNLHRNTQLRDSEHAKILRRDFLAKNGTDLALRESL